MRARLLVPVLGVLALVGCGGAAQESAQPPPATETAAQQTATASQQPASGPAPKFKLEDGEFVGMGQVKKALDEAAKFVLVDARVPEDFASLHIPGAVSLPFYEVDERYSELPKDEWIVAYCSCPTAEAEALVEVLRAQGYDKTAVLLEGFPAWVDAGYPTTSGPAA